MSEPGMFANRLRKNARHRRKWALTRGLTAYRLYDREIPEYPFAVDFYAGLIHVLEYPRRRDLRGGALEQLRAEVRAAIAEVLETPPADLFLTTHLPKAWGREQYEATGQSGVTRVVEENGLKLEVRLGAYLDTGLFMDHRNTRQRVGGEAKGRRVLNLFAYTGAFSVYAARGQAAAVATVDFSATYLDWARRNFALNGLPLAGHPLIQADVLQWLAQERGRYDLIVLDPPSHSVSKRMEGSFDVQRDHPRLLRQVLSLLARGGALYFSTNYLGFSLDARAVEGFAAEELTPRSIPEDFHQRDVHRCWRIAARD